MPTKDIHGLEVEKTMTKPKGKNYLFVIGIDQYAHCPALHNAVKDAKDIVGILKKRFQFEAANIRELYDQDANKNNIYTNFRELAIQVTPADSLLIYFSGHGEYDKIFNLGYWIPVEAKKDRVDQYVPNSEIRNILSAIKSHHTFLMVDSCFSGVLFAKSGSRNISLRKERDASRWGLTAGRNEIVTDGAKGKNSPFAKSILYQLKNTDHPIGVAELCDKVLEVVSANANQTPRGEPLKVDGHQGGQFVFHLKKDEAADWKACLSLVDYQSFLKQYPTGRFANQAKTKIKKLKAESLWQRIEQTKDSDIQLLNKKYQLIKQYVAEYSGQLHYSEALNVGELLDYKKKFLQAKNSEFSLRRFLGERVPSISGATNIHQDAQRLLDDLIDGEKDRKITADNKRLEEQRKKAEAEKLAATQRKKQAEVTAQKAAEQKRKTLVAQQKKTQEAAKRKAEKIAKEKQDQREEIIDSTPSFLQQYGKYLIAGLVAILGIWGVSQIGSGDDTKTLTQGKTFVEEQNTDSKKDTETSIATPVVEEPTAEVFEPLALSYKWGKEEIKVKLSGGKTPYTISLEKNGDEKYTKQYDREGVKTIAITKAYRKDAGRYSLLLSDANNNTITKRLKIDPIKNTSTTSSNNTGTFTDSRDNQSYKWVRLKDGKKWMAQNLNYKLSGSWHYKDNKSNGKKYGRLYTWVAAKKACPTGWRLPSDNEWWKMASYYGKAYNAQGGQAKNDGGKAAYKALIKGGNSGFAAVLGGYRYPDGPFGGLGVYGDYRSSAEESSSNAWLYSFSSHNQNLSRGNNNKTVGRSCRCLQN